MRSRLALVFSLTLAAIALAQLSPAAIVIGPGKKMKIHAPDQEEMSGTAQELFERGEASESAGNYKSAIKAYRSLVRRHSQDALAPAAAWRMAVVQEKIGDDYHAASSYRIVTEVYPKSPHFEDAIEAQFRIGEKFMQGKKVKIIGVPIYNTLDHATEVFNAIIRSAPYGKYTARAQFDQGRVAEKQNNIEGAIASYQAVVEKYPNEPIAADAQYQIGYIWFNQARNGMNDANAIEKAKLGFQDFIFRYPKSEKIPQARENLKLLAQKQTSDAFSIAKFYDRQKNYRAAVIYYNDVIREQPGSPAGDRAKQRVAELRAKVGDDKLQSAALTAATAKPPKKTATAENNSHPGLGPASGAPPMKTSPNDVAPLPPPEADESLPPPASMMPDTTTAPEPSPSPAGSPQ